MTVVTVQHNEVSGKLLILRERQQAVRAAESKCLQRTSKGVRAARKGIGGLLPGAESRSSEVRVSDGMPEPKQGRKCQAIEFRTAVQRGDHRGGEQTGYQGTAQDRRDRDRAVERTEGAGLETRHLRFLVGPQPPVQGVGGHVPVSREDLGHRAQGRCIRNRHVGQIFGILQAGSLAGRDAAGQSDQDRAGVATQIDQPVSRSTTTSECSL